MGWWPVLAQDAAAQSDDRIDQAKQAKCQHWPAERYHGGVGEAEDQRTRIHALCDRVQHGESKHAVSEQQACRYDAGDKLGFLKATVEFALRRDDLGGPFREYLKGLKL